MTERNQAFTATIGEDIRISDAITDDLTDYIAELRVDDDALVLPCVVTSTGVGAAKVFYVTCTIPRSSIETLGEGYFAVNIWVTDADSFDSESGLVSCITKATMHIEP